MLITAQAPILACKTAYAPEPLINQKMPEKFRPFQEIWVDYLTHLFLQSLFLKTKKVFKRAKGCFIDWVFAAETIEMRIKFTGGNHLRKYGNQFLLRFFCARNNQAFLSIVHLSASITWLISSYKLHFRPTSWNTEVQKIGSRMLYLGHWLVLWLPWLLAKALRGHFPKSILWLFLLLKSFEGFVSYLNCLLDCWLDNSFDFHFFIFFKLKTYSEFSWYYKNIILLTWKTISINTEWLLEFFVCGHVN